MVVEMELIHPWVAHKTVMVDLVVVDGVVLHHLRIILLLLETDKLELVLLHQVKEILVVVETLDQTLTLVEAAVVVPVVLEVLLHQMAVVLVVMEYDFLQHSVILHRLHQIHQIPNLLKEVVV
jgi:hypothetical protein